MALIVERILSRTAHKGGVKVGDRILKVNGHRVQDELEYRFYSGEEVLELEIQRIGVSQTLTKRITQTQSRDLVFVQQPPLQCSNRCIFCFVDQLPDGLRPSLYIKDEDYRLSFLNGTYVTLSTVTETMLKKICTMRLSPLYVSVHATDPTVRNMMLGRPHSRDILETLRTLARAGIVVHAQIVLCPGINDGEVLSTTIRDLRGLYPWVATVAIVPVGLTQYRKHKHLYPLRPITRAYAVRLIDEIERIQADCRYIHNTTFVFLSDEFYLKAKRRFPPYAFYGEFSQIENGVGMIPMFEQAWKHNKPLLWKKPLRGRQVIVVTGKLAYPYVTRYLNHHVEAGGVNVRAVAVPNRFFGPGVTVTGLLTGRDVIAELQPIVKQGAIVLIPDVMLKQDEDIFLDDVTLTEVATALKAEVRKFTPHPKAFEKVLYHTAFKV